MDAIYSQDCGIGCCVALGAENVRRRCAAAEVSRVWIYRVRDREQKSANAPAFRSAVIDVRGWPNEIRALRQESNKSPDLSLADVDERLASKALRLDRRVWHQ